MIFFSDAFGVLPEKLDEYGALNVSLVIDFPLFIDPFLLFNSPKVEYQNLHAEMIRYLRFLRDEAGTSALSEGVIRNLYSFPEVAQTWLGVSRDGNRGRGLGRKFARALHYNLQNVFRSFGQEQITKGSHLEKLTLITDGVGRDMISDFTTNMIKSFLARYTEAFARLHIAKELRARHSLSKVTFNYQTKTWMPAVFELPTFNDSFVLLTPKDLLTKDETWINKHGLRRRFFDIPDAIPSSDLRAQINSYFASVLPRDPNQDEKDEAIEKTIRQFPVLIDYYIRYCEEHGNNAVSVSQLKVTLANLFFGHQGAALCDLLKRHPKYLSAPASTFNEAKEKVQYLKEVIELNDGYRFFYVDGQPVRREEDAKILFKLCWLHSPSDINREVNNGRGPADFVVSRGAEDKTVVEFKLASSSSLEKNLLVQADIYQKAGRAQAKLFVVVLFSAPEQEKLDRILNAHNLRPADWIVTIDARRDNKPSGSKAEPTLTLSS